MVVILLIGCFICALLLLLTIKVEFKSLIRGRTDLGRADLVVLSTSLVLRDRSRVYFTVI